MGLGLTSVASVFESCVPNQTLAAKVFTKREIIDICPFRTSTESAVTIAVATWSGGEVLAPRLWYCVNRQSFWYFFHMSFCMLHWYTYVHDVRNERRIVLCIRILANAYSSNYCCDTTTRYFGDVCDTSVRNPARISLELGYTRRNNTRGTGNRRLHVRLYF